MIRRSQGPADRQVLWQRPWLFIIMMLAGFSFMAESPGASGQLQDIIVLEDFRQLDEDGFPEGWAAQRSLATAKATYTIRREKGITFLEAKDASQRVYTKKIVWDPKIHPILTWRWRVRSIPDHAEFVAAVYPSLDTDLMFIPVNTKYVWSLTKKVGTTIEGGMFGSSEVVIRSGTEPLGEWVEERINVYEDFRQIHGHDPAAQAWGISLLGGPGVEVDFGSLAVSAP